MYLTDFVLQYLINSQTDNSHHSWSKTTGSKRYPLAAKAGEKMRARQQRAIANFLPPSSIAVSPPSQTIKPLHRVGKMRAPKSESPNRVEEILPNSAMTGGTSI